ncbi:MAG: type IV pilus modification protein PilV [Lautropia sp.]|nr:type IV pilus modification protein PilV [Lautropia sp.]
MLKRTGAGHATLRPQAGFSLIEVLVAVVLLSIGMLAMLMAQTRAMQYARTAELRSVAIQYANDLIDRMRANSKAADNYVHDKPYDPNSKIGDLTVNCGQVECSAKDMATYDLTMLRHRLRGNLPGGDVFVERDSSTGMMKVWVLWQQPSNDELDSAGTSLGSLCPSGIGQVDPMPQCLPVGAML